MTAHKSVPHEQAMELLPWLINDSLNRDERATVLAHSQSCVICRREMKALEDLRDSIQRLFGTVSIPTLDMRIINSRIDKHISMQNRGRRVVTWLGELFRSPWRTAYAAQTVLLIVLAAALLWPATRDTEYTTLTQTPDLAAGHYVRAVFSPDLTHSGINDLLEDLQLRIVAGPSDRGVYTLATENSNAVEERDDALELLSQNQGVLFAQPVNQGARQ